MTLHDEFTALNEVFFDTDNGFAEEVIYFPRGLDRCKFTIAAVVDWADEEGSNQVRGDGRSSLNQGRGRQVRRSVIVELPTSRKLPDGLEIPLEVNEDGRDRIEVKLHGSKRKVTLAVKRILARDVAVQTILCTRASEFAAQAVRMGRVG